MSVRTQIRREVEAIDPFDEIERSTKQRVLSWIDSGAELCRLKKPATPPQHLVSYFVLTDGDYVLLVDHINAQLWLPTGGHVDPGEHPRDTVVREAHEEIGVNAKFLLAPPLLLTMTETVGITAGHTDVSLWYVLRGNRHSKLIYDDSEFRDARWFHRDQIPKAHSDPNMNRFLSKLYAA